MINDYIEVKNPETMPSLADATVALDFLLGAKTGVKNYAIALAEAITPEVRNVLRAQLDAAINLHEEIYTMMINKGWFLPNDLQKQFQMVIESSKTASQIASLDLFPGDTSKRGTFTTLEK
ncbi:MAG: spore coat protein [Clostridiaceae bacterium]